MLLQLPKPAADALSASRSLQEKIAHAITSNENWISFACYMDLALYAPGSGYYSGGSAKLGKDGDFTTAPEMTPLFGRTLAKALVPFLKDAPHILEFGAGTGLLAKDLLSELQKMGVTVESYRIMELSGELRQRQHRTLEGFSIVEWPDELPAQFSGAVIGNEVLDAMPVELVVRTDSGWSQRGVSIENERFVFSDRPLDPGAPETASLLSQIPEADTLPCGYLTEVHPIARGFISTLGAMLERGAAIFIDYGFPAAEFYLEQRSRGTLMCHYRHHAHDDPFFLPGLQDLTAHVDFTAIAKEAIESGLDVLGYMSQAAFLLASGLPSLLQETDPQDAVRYLPQTNAVQRLTSPAEMGELFKVLILGKQVRLTDSLATADRSHRL